jgi:hypothetical protein
MDLEITFNANRFKHRISPGEVTSHDPFFVLSKTLYYQVSHIDSFIDNSDIYINFANENINYITQSWDYKNYKKTQETLRDFIVTLEDYYKYYNIINDNTKSILPPFFNTSPGDILKYIMLKDRIIPKVGKVLPLGKFFGFTATTEESEKLYTPIAKCIICKKINKIMYVDKSISKAFCGVKCQEKYYKKEKR